MRNLLFSSLQKTAVFVDVRLYSLYSVLMFPIFTIIEFYFLFLKLYVFCFQLLMLNVCFYVKHIELPQDVKCAI